MESAISDYNNLINHYNNLKNEKNNENIKIKDSNNNIKDFNKNFNKSKAKTRIPSKEKNNDKKIGKFVINKKIKNILITENNKNANCLDSNYINNLKKENERLKNLIINYDYTNRKIINFNQKKIKLLKERKNIVNKKSKKISEKKKRPISSNNSKDRSYLGKFYNKKFKNIQNNINNKSEIMLLMNKTNYSIVQKNKFKDLIINEKHLKKTNTNKNIDTQFFNTISSIKNDENYFSNKSIIKHHTSINSIKKSDVKKNTTNQKTTKKLKVKCKNNNDKINNIGKSGYFPETSNIIKYKKIYKNTPKLNNEINTNRSFFSSSNNNNYNKIKNRLKHLKVFDLNNNSFNINFERTNSSERDYYSKYNKNGKNKNLIKSQINKLKTEININNKSRLVIQRNTDNKKINKLKIIKESNTEKNDYYKNENNNNLLILNNEKELLCKNNNSIEIKKDNKTNKNSFSKIKKNIINNNLEEINNANKKKLKIIKNINNHEIKKNILIDYNILCGCLSLNNINKNINNDSKLILNRKKKIITNENSYIKTNPLKKLNKTINNINNFSNCNYIYLLNNGDKFIKTKRNFKV